MSRPILMLFAHTFFGSFMPIYALASLMLVDHGLTGNEVAVVLAAWPIAILLFEVPSSALADRTSRKWILVFSQALGAIAFAAWAVHPTFYGFLAGYALWGVKTALVSGTYEAYVYDELVACGREETFVASYGRLNMTRSVAAMLASLSTMPLSRYGYDVVVWSSVGMTLISMCFVLCLPEAARTKIIGEGAYVRILRTGFKTIVGNSQVLLIALGFASVTALASMTGDFGPVLGRLSGLPQSGIGLYVAISYAVIALGYASTDAIFKRIGKRFIWLLPSGALLFTISSLILSVPTLTPVFAWMFATCISLQLYNNELQKHAGSEVRATVSSVAGFMATILQVILTVFVGAVAGAWSYQVALICFGIIGFIIGIAIVLLSIIQSRTG